MARIHRISADFSLAVSLRPHPVVFRECGHERAVVRSAVCRCRAVCPSRSRRSSRRCSRRSDRMVSFSSGDPNDFRPPVRLSSPAPARRDACDVWRAAHPPLDRRVDSRRHRARDRVLVPTNRALVGDGGLLGDQRRPTRRSSCRENHAPIALNCPRAPPPSCERWPGHSTPSRAPGRVRRRRPSIDSTRASWCGSRSTTCCGRRSASAPACCSGIGSARPRPRSW